MRPNWNQFGNGRQKHGSQVKHAEGVVELNTWGEAKREECERKERIWGKFILLLNQSIVGRRHTDTRKHTHRNLGECSPSYLVFLCSVWIKTIRSSLLPRLFDQIMSHQAERVCVCSWALVCVIGAAWCTVSMSNSNVISNAVSGLRTPRVSLIC